MTDPDSASLKFIVIADKTMSHVTCDLGEREMREVLLKIFLDNDIHKMLDLSSEFFEQFGKRIENITKQVGLYELENIENGKINAICVNLKEYFELYGILYEVNKKHKGVRKGTKGMDFDNYAGRILHIDEAREGTNRFVKKNKQIHFQNKKGNKYMVTIEKSEFGKFKVQSCKL